MVSNSDRMVSYGYEKSFKNALPQILAVTVKNLLLFGVGMAQGFPTLLIPAVIGYHENDISLSAEQITWIGSINLITTPVGCALSGVVSNPFGRRRSMQMINIPFAIAWILLWTASSFEQLCFGLGLTGLAGGLLEAPVLSYVSEVTEPHLRGALSGTSTMFVNIGVFVQFFLGIYFDWRTIAIISLIVPVVTLIAMFFVPESPYWLINRNRMEEASKSLQWLRGWTNAKTIEKELEDMKVTLEKEKESSNQGETLKEMGMRYTKKTFLKPFFLVSAVFFVAHFSGQTSLQTYAVQIFKEVGSPIDEYKATLILGVIQMIGCICCVTSIHFVGKRKLTFISTIGAGLCCCTVAGYQFFFIKGASEFADEHAVVQEKLSWIPTTALFCLAFLTTSGIRIIPWILIGEVFTAQTRAGAAALSSATGYVFGFLANKFFILLLSFLHIHGTYLMYGVICFLGAILFFFTLPETEGKRLMDIENHFAGVQKLSIHINYKNKSEDIDK